MSVALENARLFDETQRLLKETEQRAAELAIINSVQEALAAELNIQGIYDTVGDKIREIFNQRSGHPHVDPKTESFTIPTPTSTASGIAIVPHPLRKSGLPARPAHPAKRWSSTRTWREAGEIRQLSCPAPDGEVCRLRAVVAGDQARGLIDLMDMEREHAFSDSDVRLLQTLANAMSVALENARLFDETQRRTRETAALAEVGRDISSTLDLATVMDRIARHAKDLLNADSSAIFLPDAARQSYRAIVAVGDVARGDPVHGDRGRASASSAASSRAAAPSSSTIPAPTRAAIQIPGTRSRRTSG